MNELFALRLHESFVSALFKNKYFQLDMPQNQTRSERHSDLASNI